MKYIIEFGVRGGAHTENLILPTRKLATDLARKLDGVPRGPASSALWRKPTGPEPMSEHVIPWNS